MNKIDDFKCIPTRLQHNNRNEYNIFPAGSLAFHGELDPKNRKIYIDEEGRKWVEMFWYHSMFHNPVKNIKLQHYDCDEITRKGSIGSSEVKVPKKFVAIHSDIYHTIDSSHIISGSYNYRDFEKVGHFAHFWADVLPTAFFCSCIGGRAAE